MQANDIVLVEGSWQAAGYYARVVCHDEESDNVALDVDTRGDVSLGVRWVCPAKDLTLVWSNPHISALSKSKERNNYNVFKG